MDETLQSTLSFKSNLQVISAPSIQEDKNFLASVRDPFALTEMKRRHMNLTQIQQWEYDNAALHCIYAFKDDYPWGTVIDESGKEKGVCKCINVDCKRFSECRPDFTAFDQKELGVVEENERVSEQTQKAAKAFSEVGEPEEKFKEVKGDDAALAVLFSGKLEEKQQELPEEHAEVVVPSEEISVKSEEISAIDIKPGMPDATFASFMTVPQDKVIQLEPTNRTIVNAGPGTGKTWTLIEKVKYMLTQYEVDPENILVLCFSRAAVDVVRSRLKEAADRGELPQSWNMVEVRTFDSFSTYMLSWVADNLPDLLPEGYVLEKQDYDARIATATTVFQREKDMLAEYSHVIVDEVQDLVGARAEMVLALLESLPETCGFTLFGDSCQALYDYMASDDPEILSSNDFYKSLFHEFRDANYYAFDENHRQGDKLAGLTVPYRNAILTGSADDRAKEASILDSGINEADLNLVYFSLSDAAEYTRNGTLGILTRTNGQALQISTWLRNEGVDHVLQKRSGEENLAGWISNVIFDAKTEVLGSEEFTKIFCRLYPENARDADMYWNALISTQWDTTGNYYEIEDLLKGLIKNARNPLLFKEPQENDSARITVSSIHRAKGREFDSVLVAEDVISSMYEDNKDNDLEHKVCYVALTRPKKRLEKVKLDTQYIYIVKDQTRRCFKGNLSRYKKNSKYLSHFEVGVPGDMDERSFAFSKERQEAIRNSVKNDYRLKLVKCPEEPGRPVIYKLVIEDKEKDILGYTTEKFYRSMKYAIQRIYGKYGQHIAYKYFPNRFNDIYIEGQMTCISADGEGLDGARQFGSMYIWNGVSIEGFAQMEKDRY